MSKKNLKAARSNLSRAITANVAKRLETGAAAILNPDEVEALVGAIEGFIDAVIDSKSSSA